MKLCVVGISSNGMDVHVWYRQSLYYEFDKPRIYKRGNEQVFLRNEPMTVRGMLDLKELYMGFSGPSFSKREVPRGLRSRYYDRSLKL